MRRPKSRSWTSKQVVAKYCSKSSGNDLKLGKINWFLKQMKIDRGRGWFPTHKPLTQGHSQWQEVRISSRSRSSKYTKVPGLYLVCQASAPKSWPVHHFTQCSSRMKNQWHQLQIYNISCLALSPSNFNTKTASIPFTTWSLMIKESKISGSNSKSTIGPGLLHDASNISTRTFSIAAYVVSCPIHQFFQVRQEYRGIYIINRYARGPMNLNGKSLPLYILTGNWTDDWCLPFCHRLEKIFFLANYLNTLF